ncbi:MAG TPA: gliding motility-associated C-terminal domain-containing protein [Paludibacter sp.]|nr:gliding motility-associated C-terminal domain-containing protein [Paludibacter sp.]
MKKISLLICLCLWFVGAFAQLELSSKTGKSYQKISNNDTVQVFIFNGISSTDTIKFTGSGNTANWFEYSETISNTSNYFPDLTNIKDATGYILVVDGKKTAVWVIDYSKYLPNLISIEPDAQSENACTELDMLINADIPKLIYKTVSGNSYELPRTFTVNYQTKKWDNSAWVPDSLKYTITLPATKLSVTAPFCDTKFIISGDQYAQNFGLDIRKTSEYTAVAVECHLKPVVTSRKPKNGEKSNEDSYPDSDKQPISFSVPIDVQFLSNANPAATYFNWTIYKDDQLIINRTDQDHRYSFTDYGTYKVKVVVSSSKCSYSDSITINAYEAAIQVPNVFTPNGDGTNDEFRVAYKSLLGFECWVSNRWGRKVYYWNDPTKGWNGKIGGADAAEGPYFYIIKATGYGLDPKKHDPKVKSTIILKGDINLLRGLKK